MPSSWRIALITLFGAAAVAGGGALVAQMESADRGILPIDSSGTLEITGIHVDVGGKDAASARFAGWRVAQREGFKALWAKTNKRPISEAPTLGDSVLDGLVASIVVEREQIGPTRYIADLGVLFDRTRAGALLGVGGIGRRSEPLLLIPLTVSAGAVTSVELKNHWQRAWASYRTAQSAIDYVRVSGLGADPLLVNAAQSRRPGRSWWRNILDLYGAANVLVAEVRMHRLYPGGPSRAVFTGRFGPDGDKIGSFELTARDSADIARMMNEGVQRMDALYTRALAAGLLTHDSSLDPPPPPVIEEAVEEEEKKPDQPPARPIQMLVTSPDSAGFVAAVSAIRGIDGVVGVAERSVSASGTSSIIVNYRGDSGRLRSALEARGWALDVLGGMLNIYGARQLPAPPPPPQPAPPVPPAPAPAAAPGTASSRQR